MIAVDTNLLVYAHREDMPEHDAARAALTRLATEVRWALPWPCVHEFLSAVTSARVWDQPTPRDRAVDAVEQLLAMPNVTLLAESRRHRDILLELVRAAPVSGARVHDAKIAAICLGHDVAELWTADRDFSLFPALRTRNPLVASG